MGIVVESAEPPDEVDHQPQHAGAQDEGDRDGSGISGRGHQGQFAQVDPRQPGHTGVRAHS